MNSQALRTLIAQTAIATSLCAGASFFLVQPTQKSLAQTRTEIEALQAAKSSMMGVSNLTDKQVGELAQQTRKGLDDIRERSEFARNESSTYSNLSDLAQRMNVRIEQFSPAAIVTTPSNTGAFNSAPPPLSVSPQDPSQPAPSLPAPPADTRVGFSISLRGSYADVTHFLNALTNELGYSIITSVRIQQSEPPESRMVHVNITTEHLSFDTSSIKLPSGSNVPASPSHP